MYTHVCVLSYLLVLSVYGGTWVLDLSGAGASPSVFFFLGIGPCRPVPLP